MPTIATSYGACLSGISRDITQCEGLVNPMPSQVETLQMILQQVEEYRLAGGLPPVVEIDLDLTALLPVVRTRLALEKLAKQLGLPELVDAGALLPGYSDEAWVSFLTVNELPARFPDLPWFTSSGKPDRKEGTPFGQFHQAYWTTEWLIEDEAAPGLCPWVQKVEARGGRVVFISGRWLKEQRQPTLECLRRAGIPNPLLIIGNDRHETLVGPELALSDAQVKVKHQSEIRSRFGEPVAIIDDRPANRAAVAQTPGSTIMPVAITAPNFTHDRENDGATWRISTFELFDDVLGDPPRHDYMLSRYGRLGESQPWLGMYEGLGANGLPYAVRRCIGDEDKLPGLNPPFGPLLRGNGRPLPEHEFLQMCEGTIPPEVFGAIDSILDQASRLAECGMAASFAQNTKEFDGLRHSLLASWLHSRDIETIMAALGFPLKATGVHDVHEFALSNEIKDRILLQDSDRYSPWLLAWIEQLPDNSQVDVGCFNPSLAAGMWHWKPSAQKQDAMDVHRLSSHHQGDRGERYDPLEAAVNNVLHQREGMCGIRKEPVAGWQSMARNMLLPSKATALAKTGIGIGLYRDLIQIAPKLERAGFITPWSVVSGEQYF